MQRYKLYLEARKQLKLKEQATVSTQRIELDKYFIAKLFCCKPILFKPK